MGGWSDEQYLIGHDKYILNTYSSNHGDLPGNFNNKDVHHKRIRMIGT